MALTDGMGKGELGPTWNVLEPDSIKKINLLST